jgi:hypothetical protein
MTKKSYLEQLEKIIVATEKVAEAEQDKLTIENVIDILRLQFDVLREVYNQNKDGDTNG